MDDYPYQDDDEAMPDIVIGRYVFDTYEEAVLYCQRLSWERTQRRLRALDEHQGIPYRPDSVDGVISPDSRAPRDWSEEFRTLMLADTLFGFVIEAESRLLRVYDPD